MAGGGLPNQDDAEDEGVGFTEPNIVPLVDIMLVLLVILMAGSSAIVNSGGEGVAPGSGFKVNLPSGAADRAMATVTNELIVTVLESGEVVVGGTPVSMSDLEILLRTEAGTDPDRLVLVQADEKAVHARVVEVMEVARGAGLSNLAIATRGAEPEE